MINPLIPKSDKVLISLYNLSLESNVLSHENRGNDQYLMKLFMVFKFTLLEPKKCVENSMEGMHNDVTV